MSKELSFVWSKQVIKFLKKNIHRIDQDDVEKIIKAWIYKAFFGVDIAVDIKRMKGKQIRFRIRKWNIRIIFSIDHTGKIWIVAIEIVHRRGSVY